MGYRTIRKSSLSLPDELATDLELTSAIADHEAASDPHPQYSNAERFEVGWGLLYQQVRIFYNLYPDASGNIYPTHFNEQILLDKNSVLQLPSPLLDGVYNFLIAQGASAHYTVAFNSQYKWVEGVEPTITQVNGATDVISCVANGSIILCVHQGNFS